MDFELRLRQRLESLEATVPGPTRQPARSALAGKRRALRSFALASALVLTAFVSGVAVARDTDPSGVVGHPGLENAGQPFEGVNLQCMTPPQAQAVIAGKGFHVIWQIEDRDSSGRGSTTLSTAAPLIGVVEGGFIEGMTAHVVVSVGTGAVPFDAC